VFYVGSVMAFKIEVITRAAVVVAAAFIGFTGAARAAGREINHYNKALSSVEYRQPYYRQFEKRGRYR
jgi:hypothetical protein